MVISGMLRRRIGGLATAMLVSGGLGLACLGAGSGAALAIPSSPHHWCPGDSMNPPTGPGADKVWDMSICHTWYFVKEGYGNVQTRYGTVSGNVFDGDNPPPGAIKDCGYDLIGIPIHC